MRRSRAKAKPGAGFRDSGREAGGNREFFGGLTDCENPAKALLGRRSRKHGIRRRGARAGWNWPSSP